MAFFLAFPKILASQNLFCKIIILFLCVIIKKYAFHRLNAINLAEIHFICILRVPN